MAISTSPDGITTPSSTDPYALTTDLAVFADTVQAALIARANKVGPSLERTAAAALAPEGMLWYDTTIGVLCIKGVSTWTAVSPLVQYGDTSGFQPTAVRQLATFNFPRAYISRPGLSVSSYMTPGGSVAWANPSLVSTSATQGAFFYCSDFEWQSAEATFSWIAIGIPQL